MKAPVLFHVFSLVASSSSFTAAQGDGDDGGVGVGGTCGEDRVCCRGTPDPKSCAIHRDFEGCTSRPAAIDYCAWVDPVWGCQVSYNACALSGTQLDCDQISGCYWESKPTPVSVIVVPVLLFLLMMLAGFVLYLKRVKIKTTASSNGTTATNEVVDVESPTKERQPTTMASAEQQQQHVQQLKQESATPVVIPTSGKVIIIQNNHGNEQENAKQQVAAAAAAKEQAIAAAAVGGLPPLPATPTPPPTENSKSNKGEEEVVFGDEEEGDLNDIPGDDAAAAGPLLCFNQSFESTKSFESTPPADF